MFAGGPCCDQMVFSNSFGAQSMTTALYGNSSAEEEEVEEEMMRSQIEREQGDMSAGRVGSEREQRHSEIGGAVREGGEVLRLQFDGGAEERERKDAFVTVERHVSEQGREQERARGVERFVGEERIPAQARAQAQTENEKESSKRRASIQGKSKEHTESRVEVGSVRKPSRVAERRKKEEEERQERQRELSVEAKRRLAVKAAEREQKAKEIKEKRDKERERKEKEKEEKERDREEKERRRQAALSIPAKKPLAKASVVGSKKSESSDKKNPSESGAVPHYAGGKTRDRKETREEQEKKEKESEEKRKGKVAPKRIERQNSASPRRHVPAFSFSTAARDQPGPVTKSPEKPVTQ